MRLYQLSRVSPGGIHHSHERTDRKEEIQICNCICGSLIGPEVRSLHFRDKIRGNYIRQEIFERHTADFNVRVEHYHCNNSRFVHITFLQHCEGMGQGITYCGVNSHFQNRRYEKDIRDLQTMAQKIILRAKG